MTPRKALNEVFKRLKGKRRPLNFFDQETNKNKDTFFVKALDGCLIRQTKSRCTNVVAFYLSNNIESPFIAFDASYYNGSSIKVNINEFALQTLESGLIQKIVSEVEKVFKE